MDTFKTAIIEQERKLAKAQAELTLLKDEMKDAKKLVDNEQSALQALIREEAEPGLFNADEAEGD